MREGGVKEEIYLEGAYEKHLEMVDLFKKSLKDYKDLWFDKTEVENFEDHPFYKHLTQEGSLSKKDKEKYIHKRQQYWMPQYIQNQY